MLRIDEAEADGLIVLYLQGRLVSDWVDEVRSTLKDRSRRGRIRLDLTDLQYADGSGIQLLRSAHREGVELHSENPYPTALIEIATRRDE